MPAPMTEMQRKFAFEYASNGGNATAAARAAGYSEKTAHEIGRQTLEKDHVREEIQRHLMRLRFRSGAVGLDALIRIAQDGKAPAAARVSAARALCEHAGLLGTAKEVQAARDEADQDGGRLMDARDVLRVLRGGRADVEEKQA